MKLTIVFLVLSYAAFAQPSELRIRSGPLFERRVHQTYIEEITFINARRETAIVRTFTRDNQRIAEEHYANYDQGTKYGLTRCWYPNGQLYWACQYKLGDMHGPLFVYHPDGSTKRREYFKRGKSNESQCFDAAGQVVDCKSFVQSAGFSGTDRELTDALKKQFDSMNIARLDNGRYISVRGIVEEDGSLTNVNIHPSNHELAEPLKIAIARLPYWQPALVDDQVVPGHYNQTFLFREQDVQIVRLR